MDPSFLKFAFPHVRNFIKVSLNLQIKLKIDEAACKHLGVSNLTNLRDVYEGERYYNSFMNRTFAEAAVEQYLSIKFVDWERRKNQKDYKPILKIGKFDFNIIVSKYGELPIVASEVSEHNIVCMIAEKRVVWICGYFKLSNPKVRISNTSFGVSKTKIKGRFDSFEILQPFIDVEDLIKLCEIHF
jgi:hypothetical protein